MQKRMVKAAAVYCNMSLTEIAQELGISLQNLNNKLNRGSLKYADMKKIADILGAEYVYEEHFVFPDGTKI